VGVKPASVAHRGLWDRGPVLQNGRKVTKPGFSRIVLESRAIEGESPVRERVQAFPSGIPSSAMSVKLRVNPRSPLRKAKYYLATDSAPVA